MDYHPTEGGGGGVEILLGSYIILVTETGDTCKCWPGGPLDLHTDLTFYIA